MKNRNGNTLISAALATLTLLGSMPAGADSKLKSGRQVYRSLCIQCHGPGPIDAPKLGDRKAWAPLIAEGQAVVTAHGWVGVREMPPRGGGDDLSLEEFGRAVAHMARASGAAWSEPDSDATLMAAIRTEVQARIAELEAKARNVADGGRTGEAVYRSVCTHCHEAGVAGAPRFGNRKDWKPLIDEGQHVITAHGWVGVRAMPPRGGHPELSLEEFARAVSFMAGAAGADWIDPTGDSALMARIREEEAERRTELAED